MFRRKDGLWQEQITIEVNGQKKQKYFYGSTRTEVKRKMAEYTGEKEKGPYFREVAEVWHEEHFERVAVNTRKNYEKPYARAVAEFGGDRIKAITPKRVELYLRELAARGFAQKSIATHKLVLSLIFKHAILCGEITYDPCSAVITPRGRPKVPRGLPEDGDIARVIASTSLPLGLYHLFILYTGCRRGEAMAMRWGDIDFDHKTIHVSRSVYYDGAIPAVKEPKTAAGVRTVPLLDPLADALPSPGAPEQYVFFPDGVLPYKTTFERHLRQYRAASGVTATPHQLRHAYASILDEAGLTDKEAQELLGHASIQMTKDIYTHISTRRRQAAADKLNSFVTKKDETP